MALEVVFIGFKMVFLWFDRFYIVVFVFGRLCNCFLVFY